ncbi:MAG: DUF4625 domain-containing protein [Bacteroidales bacterium]|nr:DUF4625 domain-containing protein [Bacteroidales bacterium]
MFSRSFLLVFFSFIGILLISCKKENDTIPPQISISEPKENEIFKIDSLGKVEIHFNATFSDDEELGSYKIDIHSAAGHSHKSNLLISSFDTSITGALSGRQYVLHQHILIPHFPLSDTGQYHLLVFCLDKAGNQTTTFRTFEITK